MDSNFSKMEAPVVASEAKQSRIVISNMRLLRFARNDRCGAFTLLEALILGLSVFFASTLFGAGVVQAALPEPEAEVSDPVATTSQSRKDQILAPCDVEHQGECIEPNNMINAFEGWNHAYYGYQRSPILFDPKEENVRKRKYPQLSKAPKEGSRQQNLNEDEKGLGDVLDVSADDEILKTKMAIYQPISDLQKSFTNDDKARDDHLDLFSTIRGVAILTLSYLDKTVAAGLATIQQQADEDTTQHLLKQISWTSSQLANPHRNQLYVDVDEKVEACMASRMGQGRLVSFSSDLCEDKCGEQKQGDYRYCVCCAEVVETVNASVEDFSTPGGSSSASDVTKWSLIERVMWGVKIPELDATGTGGTGSTQSDKIKFIKEYIRTFRTLYGDIVFKPVEESSGNGLSFSYIYPSFSVPQLIQQLRLGPYLYEDLRLQACVNYDETSGAPEEGVIYCPITQEKMKYGICPALRFLLQPDEWPLPGPTQSIQPPHFPLDKPKAEYSEAELNALLEVWVEASLGIMLSAADIENIKVMGKTDPGRMSRWIDAFCDASAVAAFQRLHTRMISIALDHLTLNQKATEQDKEKVRRLMGRVTEYMTLANVDVSAGDKSQLFLIGVSVNKDRELIKTNQLGQAAMANSHALMQRVQDFQFFGVGPSHVFNYIDEFQDPKNTTNRPGGRTGTGDSGRNVDPNDSKPTGRGR